MDFVRIRLSNGVKVILAPRAGSSAVAVQVWIFGGSRLETELKVGLAHLVEHMVMFRGGRDFPDSRSMEREARLLGNRSNAVTSDEYVCYFINTSPAFLKRAIHLLSDMVVHARLDPKDLNSEKEVVVKELNSTLDDPEDYSSAKFREVIFGHGAHALGRVDCEKISTLRSLNIGDVIEHKNFFYGPPNILIVVSGGMEFADVAEMLEEYFGKMAVAAKALPVAFAMDGSLPAVKILAKPEVKQAHLYIGGLSASAKSLNLRACESLHEILSYRLWDKVRVEKNLAYDISASQTIFSDAGYFVIHAGVDPNKKDITETACIIFGEMADILSGNISDDEMEIAKSLMRIRLDLELENSGMVGCFLALNELCGRGALSPDKVHREVDSITKTDVTLMAREIWKAENIRSLLLTTSFKDYEKVYTRLRRVVRD